MSEQDERELDEFEKEIQKNNYVLVIAISVLLVVAGLGCSWFIFNMISNAINAYFGG
ncbi:MAG: hypothetical protein ACWGQW_04600 [bacterium]